MNKKLENMYSVPKELRKAQYVRYQPPQTADIKQQLGQFQLDPEPRLAHSKS